MTAVVSAQMESLLADFDEQARHQLSVTFEAADTVLAQSLLRGVDARFASPIAPLLRTHAIERERSDKSPYAIAKAALLAMNEAVSGHNLHPLDLPEETILFGKRWWKPRGGDLRFSSGWPFSCIRRVKKSEARLRTASGGANDVAQLLNSVEVVKVGLLTLSGRSQTTFSATRVLTPNRVMGFRASHVSQERTGGTVEEYLRELVQCSRRAIDSGVHVLVMPEYCVCSEGLQRLKAEIERDPGDLALVVPGTFTQEVRGGGGLSNVAPVWYVSSDGKVGHVASHYKQIPAEYHAARFQGAPTLQGLLKSAEAENCTVVREHLEVKEPILAYLSPFGLVSVGICSDLIPPDSPVAKLYRIVDQLIVPSMNDGATNAFQMAQEFVTRDCSGGYFYVNSAQVGESDSEMAIWSVPGSGGMSARRKPPGMPRRWIWKPFSEVMEQDGVIIASLPNPHRTGGGGS